MQHMKTLAYRFLLESQFTELNVPLDALQTALKKQEVVLLTYSQWNAIKRQFSDDATGEIEKGMKYNSGISIVAPQCAFILYSDNLSRSKAMYAIFHELGHIKAQHRRLEYYNFEINEEQELEADAFARFALAPPCVLNEMGGVSERLVSSLTGLDATAAHEAMRTLEIDKNNRLLALEKELLYQYRTYIHVNKEQRTNLLQKYRIAVVSVIVSVCISVLFLLYQLVPAKQKSRHAKSTNTIPAVTATSSPENETVWKTKTGEVYHTTPDCYHISKTAYAMELQDAISAGYQQCKDCKK